jgi:hypothetical protein
MDLVPPTAAAGSAATPDASKLAAYGAGMGRLPNLFIRSAGVLVFLYALLAALLIVLVEVTGMPPAAAVVVGVFTAALQFGLGPFIMDQWLGWIFDPNSTFFR